MRHGSSEVGKFATVFKNYDSVETPIECELRGEKIHRSRRLQWCWQFFIYRYTAKVPEGHDAAQWTGNVPDRRQHVQALVRWTRLSAEISVPGRKGRKTWKLKSYVVLLMRNEKMYDANSWTIWKPHDTHDLATCEIGWALRDRLLFSHAILHVMRSCGFQIAFRLPT